MAVVSPINAVSEIIMRRDESKKWLRFNYWDEWVETWRMIKCRTKPIRKIDSAGKEMEEEDKSRTNVESGLANLIFRKNVAPSVRSLIPCECVGAAIPVERHA